jgi:hypothetical protein
MAKGGNGGIDQVRLQSGEVLFDQLHPVTRVDLINVDSGILEDVFISVRGNHNPYITVSGMPFRSPNNVIVRLIAINPHGTISVDITTDLLKGLRRSLELSDQRLSRESYKAAMNSWMTYAETRLAAIYTPVQIAADRQLATELSQRTPLSSLLNQLGDRSVGTGGSLHIFNYLYGYVPLAPVSLKSLAGSHNVDLTSATFLVIEMEQPIRGGQGAIEVSGAVDYTLSQIVHNPLREQLADLENAILPSIQDIEERLSAGGSIMQSIGNAQNQMVDLKKSIESFEGKFASSLAELQVLKAAVTNLNSKIDGLH